MRSEATAAVWQERVAAWRASGETAERFARRGGYAASTLRWWSRRLGRAAAPGFVRLVPRAPGAPAAPAAPGVVVEVGGARIHVAPGFDAALLAQVVAALRGSSA